MSKLTKHSDIDAELWPGLNVNPFGLFWRLGCVASAMIFLITWLGLIVVALSGWLKIAPWYFVALPIIIWLGLIALPIFLKSRRGALGILDAIVQTAEAWMARAGFSVDINNDGRIGHYQPVIQPPIIEEHRPIPFRVAGQAKLLAHQVEAGPGVAEAEAEPETPAPAITRHVWTLPNGAKVDQAQFEEFSDRLSIVGLNRAEWVGKNKPFEREQFEGLVTLLEQAGVIEGRKKGHVGKLVIKRADHRRRVLGLPLGTVAKADDTNRLDAGKFQHI